MDLVGSGQAVALFLSYMRGKTTAALGRQSTDVLIARVFRRLVSDEVSCLTVSDAPRKILVVDDSQLTLDVVASVLRQAGYDVRTTTEVNDLREMFGSWLPNMILTDVNMPNMSGPELCAALKSSYDTAHVPVILFSAVAPELLEKLSRECEADGFLSKQDLHKLPDALEHLIERTLF